MSKRVYASATLVVAAFVFMLGSLVGVPGSAASFASQDTDGADPAGPFPAHIHSGTCDELGDIVFPLADLVPFGNQASPMASPSLAVASTPVASPVAATPVGSPEAAQEVLAESSTEVAGSLDEILAAEHAINVHESAENIQNYVSCGDLTGTPTDGMLHIELQELNESFLVGQADLMDNGDGTTTVTVRVMLSDKAEQIGTEEAPLPVEDEDATPEN